MGGKMSQEYCWECGESYARDEIFDIPVFRRGFTVKWCLNCAMKQIKLTDYRLVPKSVKHKKFRIESVEERAKKIDKGHAMCKKCNCCITCKICKCKGRKIIDRYE